MSWLDDWSRYLLACTAYSRVTGGDVVASFADIGITYGLPASTLTDNGSVYTSRFTHGHHNFKRMINSRGITRKNGHPGRPHSATPHTVYHALPKAHPAGRCGGNLP